MFVCVSCMCQWCECRFHDWIVMCVYRQKSIPNEMEKELQKNQSEASSKWHTIQRLVCWTIFIVTVATVNWFQLFAISFIKDEIYILAKRHMLWTFNQQFRKYLYVELWALSLSLSLLPRPYCRSNGDGTKIQ